MKLTNIPVATAKEADPINLAIERTKTFNNRKIYLTSTPTTDQGHIWKHLKSCDVEKHFFVPCPHCNEMIELKFEQLHIPDDPDLSEIDRASHASYICQECGAVITDADKAQALKKGEWREVKKNGKLSRSVGFWLSTLYSPFTRWADIAKAYLNAKQDRDALHNFQNSWLGIPYEEKGEELESDLIRKKQSDLAEFVIPEWCKILVAGVDVQESSLYYSVLAVGVNFTSQIITCGQTLSFSDIEHIMNVEYSYENGDKKLIDLALIDSGNDTDRVYNFCLNNSEWALPVKGSSNSMLSHYKISSVNKEGSATNGMRLVIVDGNKYKDMIASRIKRETLSGSFMTFQGISDEFCEQMTAEHKVAEVKNGITVFKWKPKKSHIDNHYLDTVVYAFAAADIMGARSLFLMEQEQAQSAIRENRTRGVVSNDLLALDTPPLEIPPKPQITEQQNNDFSEFGNDWINGGGW